MAFFDSASMSFIIRCVHVMAMALVVGGSVVLCAMCMGNRGGEELEPGGAVLRLATRYERIFWSVLAILVLTGVGNLGAFAGHLPTRETLWGRKLLIKLFCVLALMVVSCVRTSVIAHYGYIHGERLEGWARKMIGGAYAVTVLVAVAILTVALLLAHG